ncbi:TlpA family protein disulfide reductase [Flavobacteriales bacterium]|nr:TlpA family protein disulfide reductase [Flavobacteriales bacterium]
MKKIISILLILIIISCKGEKATFNNENNYYLEFIQQTDKYIYLYKIDRNNPLKIDSSKSAKGIHQFNISLLKSDIFLVGTSPEKSVLFIGSPNESNKFLFTNGEYEELVVTGDSTNVLLQKYFKFRNNIISQIQNINIPNEQEKIIKRNSILTSYQTYIKEFIAENKNSPCLIMLLGEIQNPMDFKDELTLIKIVIKEKFEQQKYLKEIVKLIEKAKQQEEFIFQQKNKVKEEQNTRKELGINIGAIAPEINLKGPNGYLISLSSLKGKVVLLDFWASWCRPCRAENPNVVRLYNKYKDKGFTVYSVSLDQNKDKWLAAIVQDQLNWSNHVSELTGWKSSAGAKYGISSIPKTFLINKKGEIIGYDLRGNELEQKLSEIL